MNAALSVQGIFQISNVVQNLNLGGSVSNTGQFIDARTNYPLDTFVRKGSSQDKKLPILARYIQQNGGQGSRGWGTVTVNKTDIGVYVLDVTALGLINTNSSLIQITPIVDVLAWTPVVFNTRTAATPTITVEAKNPSTGAYVDNSFYIVVWNYA